MLGKFVGEGKFGKVYQNADGETCSKYISLEHLSTDAASSLKREWQVLAPLNSPYIIHAYDWTTEQNQIILKMEYAPNGNLNKFLLDPNKKASLTKERKWSLIVRLLLGLDCFSFCHSISYSSSSFIRSSH